MVGVQYCDVLRAGCFRADDLDVDLGSDSETCASVAASSFTQSVELDADSSGDAGANVNAGDIYEYFSDKPSGILEL